MAEELRTLNTAQSGTVTDPTTDFTTGVVIASSLNDEIQMQVVISNTDLVGELYFQKSLDGENWENISFEDAAGTSYASYSVTSGVDGSPIFRLRESAGSYRAFWDHTSGTAGNTMKFVVVKSSN